MKIVVTGASGQLGQTLAAVVPSGVTIIGFDLPDLDISDNRQVASLFESHVPDVIVNCAAFTAVDLAESRAEEATRVNDLGAANLAAAARNIDARLIHISTDFVFDGAAGKPYPPTHLTNPLSVYGASKRAGEQRIEEIHPGNSVILRTSWLYSEYGGNFVSTMLRLFEHGKDIRVVDDQVGSPTWTHSVAKAVFEFSGRPELSGIYHWTDSGQVSWFGFASAIQEEALDLGIIKNSVEILPVTSTEYVTAAVRPAFSVLDCSATSKVLKINAEPWRQNLRAMLKVYAK